MQRREMDMIENLMDSLSYEPVVRLSKKQLRRFFKAQRLNNNSWRSLFDLLPSDVPRKELKVIEIPSDDDVYIIRTVNMKELDSLI